MRAGTVLTVPLIVWNAGVILFLAATAYARWPGLHWDSALYVTPALKLANFGQWEFDSYVPAMLDTGDTRFNMHGQLYQWLLGQVLRCGDFDSVIVWLAIINITTFAAILVTSQKCLRERFGAKAWWPASGIATAAALFCVLHQGRPEQLIPLLTMLPFGVYAVGWRGRRVRLAAYVVLGLCVVLSPLPGVLCCLGVVAWIGLREPQKPAAEIGMCAAVSLATAVGFLWLVRGLPPAAWAITNLRYGGNAPSGIGQLSMFDWLGMPLWNLGIIGGLILLTVGLFRRGLWWLALVMGIGIGSIAEKTQIYSIAGFLPVIFLALLGRQVEMLRLPAALGRLVLPVVCVIFTAFALGLARLMVLMFLLARSGVSYESAQAEISQLEVAAKESGGQIGYYWIFRPSFVAFGSTERGLISVNSSALDGSDPMLSEYESRFGRKVRFVLLPQLGHYGSPPHSLHAGAFLLRRDGWLKHRAALFGVRIGGPLPGFQFAVYERVE